MDAKSSRMNADRKADEPLEQPRRKRVHFATEEAEDQPSPPRRVTIVASASIQGQAAVAAAAAAALEEPAGPILNMDPSVAAARRTIARQEQRKAQALEDISISADVAEAEEDYDEPEERFNDMGIPIEPFHLRREREEGYFDAEGNYIEYRLDEQRDAWLEALDEQGIKVDTYTADELVARERASAAAADAADKLDEEDVAAIKKRMTDLLQPGETVLQALRRLGRGLHHPPPPELRTGDRLRQRKQRKHQQQAEQQQQQTEQQQQRQQDVTGEHDISMQAGQDKPDEADKGPSGQELLKEQQQQQQQPAGAPSSYPRPSRSAPSEHNIEFEKLTDWADQLLGAGDFDIYHKTKEQLLLEVNKALRGEAAMQSTSLPGEAGPSGTNGQPQEVGQAQLSAAGGQEQVAGGDDMFAEDFACDRHQARSGTAQPTLDASAASRDGDLEPGLTSAIVVPSRDGIGTVPGTSMSYTAAEDVSASSLASAMDASGYGPAAAFEPYAGVSLNAILTSDDVSMSEAPDAQGENTTAQLYPAEEPGAADYTSGEVDDAAAGSFEGFVLDPGSGLWYNSDLGLWYDANSQLFGDACTGVWYTQAQMEANDMVVAT